MAKFRMIQEAEVKDYFLPLPEYGKTVSVNKNTWYSDVSKLGMALLKYYSESVVFQGATKTVMETLGESESALENILAGGGTGGVDLIPDGLTSTQAKDAIYKAHELVGQDLVTQAELTTAVEGIDALTPEQTATLDKLDGLGSSASEIDNAVANSNKIIVLTQSEYDLLTPETDVFYAITE